MFNILKTEKLYGEMGIKGYCVLWETIRNTELVDVLDKDYISKKLKDLVNGTIEKDINKWSNYTIRPSLYIENPDCIYYSENKDILEKELDYLIDSKPSDDVWGITWSWYDNNEKYQKEFSISENWWKGIKAVENVKLLQSFNRL
jgi:hypothetical protein